QRVRELVVVAEPGAEEAGGGTGPGDDEIACGGDELGLQFVVSPYGDARRADQSMAETRRRQQNDVAPRQSPRRLPVQFWPDRARGYGVARGAVREHEIESPWLVRVDVRENAARDAGHFEHVGERVHRSRLVVRLRPTRRRPE